MTYISPETYSKEQRSFLFRKGENQKRKSERRITRAFLNCFSSHPEIRQGRNYYFLKALLEMPKEFYSDGLFTEDALAKAVRSATKRDGLKNFDCHEHLEWAVKAGYVDEMYKLQPENEANNLKNCMVRGKELDRETAADFLGYTINQKNVALLFKYQKERVEGLLEQYEASNHGLGRALVDIVVTLFNRK